ncbi:MAG TPA: fructosamine kinase family protein [Thiotrichales bacterium]|nr:fructosamine kinase family protein [Thiotrichales bacterium]
MIHQALAEAIGEVTGLHPRVDHAESVGGGCINETLAVPTAEGARLFVKLNDARRLDMFEAELAGLQALEACGGVRVPRALGCGLAGGRAWLALEYLPLGGRGGGARLGEGLARQHRCTAEAFGWDRDNTIGASPQPNAWDADWVRFWRERRLGFQLELAKRHGHGGELQRLGERLLDRVGDFFTDYRPVPSLLHGDLWGGNWGVLDSGEPVVFDPAVYYGDREADIAMTELFGGFGTDFRAAYEAAWPLDPGYRVRRTLYNLYHILNHLNLFGVGYLGQSIAMIERLLAEVQ